jgi:phage terminase Nu1 subunit (DNA packaging protein)
VNCPQSASEDDVDATNESAAHLNRTRLTAAAADQRRLRNQVIRQAGCAARG